MREIKLYGIKQKKTDLTPGNQKDKAKAKQKQKQR